MSKSPTIREVAAKARQGIDGLTVDELRSLRQYRKLKADIDDRLRAALGDRWTFTAEDLATMFDVSSRTIGRWARKGRLPKRDRTGYDIREVVQHLQKQLDERDEAAGMSWADRYRRGKALLVEMEVSERRSDSIPRERIFSTWQSMWTLVRQVIETIARQCHGSQCGRSIEAEFAEALKRIRAAHERQLAAARICETERKDHGDDSPGPDGG
jgi:DNA-binding transcriptional MerR regulator